MNDLHKKMLNLEILLITYNRCSHLANTLRLLESSPFRSCRITVLDNCSPDKTRETVAGFVESFPNLNYLRNRVNISGNPNYLKAIELATSEYTWILCDDDALDFSACEDVIAAVDSGAFDLIEVGATERGDWPRGCATRVQEMVANGYDYYFRMSFFPAFIFRTEKFDGACFAWGYKHIDLLYPQFEFLNKSVRENFNLYLANKRIVVRNDFNDHSFAPLTWYAAWVSCCRVIDNCAIRYRAVDDATADRGFYKCLGFWTLHDRYLRSGEFCWRVLTIMRAISWRQRLKYLIILPILILPLPFSFWVWIRRMVYKFMNVPESEVPSLNILDRG